MVVALKKAMLGKRAGGRGGRGVNVHGVVEAIVIGLVGGLFGERNPVSRVLGWFGEDFWLFVVIR